MIAEELVRAPATAEALEALHIALHRFWSTVDATVPDAPDSTWRHHLSTALGEIGANIVQHAHPPGSPTDSVCIRFRLFPHRVEVCFTDRGLAYIPPQAQAAAHILPETEADLLEHGYGLSIVRAAVDRLKYYRTPTGVNIWLLVKRW